MKSHRRIAALAVMAVAGASMLAGCSSSGGDNGGDGTVSLVVAPVLPGATADALKALSTRVKEFNKKNPKITVKAIEYQWTGTTFAAELAGGTLPDVFNVPFTDSKTLANNGQLADITKPFNDTATAKKWNKNVLSVATGDNGKIYGVPWGPYAMALSYNREIFTKAGLDPNKPPTTLDEIQQDAKTISEKVPGVAGYMQMTNGNNGGWELTTNTYALGGRMETVGSDGKVTVNTDNAQTKQALSWLKKLRWDDNSMGSNFLWDWSGINQGFASGKIAMYMSGSDVVGSLMQANGLDPKNYGVTTFPVDSSNADAGILSGGNVDVVNVKDTPEQIAAAVKWIDFYRTEPNVDKAAAEANAKALAAGNQAVGAPTLPVFDKATWEQNQQWIKPYVNVPADNVKPFTDGIWNQKIVPEPSAHTQDLYGALDAVVQAVLTQRNPDVDSMLKGVDTKIQALIDADSK
ncbi:ABC transporter substrate-binding protein [Leifsonia sp. Root112D2]|jgi:multiple sugar transport system substrate-binding protein|uniref:ABC transporter substrate-binding protein n=1 Tax=Leifsonia sp. Root112D2 TaxID=1736426 RepID=UPI0006FFF4F2|nr:extracellular solute-binding protein [Leifsonia sp. Root112D2]KQV07862.1 sugar ABC transporter substrate-binding protein [Leifsonia sp. Root112D2]